MPIPFQAATWAKRSDIPLVNFNDRIVGAGFHRGSQVLQAFTQPVWSGAGVSNRWNTAFTSLDAGRTWFNTYNGYNAQFEDSWVIAQAWSLDTPTGTFHFQIRYLIRVAFIIADGTLFPGRIALFASGDGINFYEQQTLYSWGQTNSTGVGPQAGFNAVPGISPPILVPGSGPNGEDAYWMMIGTEIQGGGNIILSVTDLWRSYDGFVWQDVMALKSVAPFSSTTPVFVPIQMFNSTSGRVIVVGVGGNFPYTSDKNLVTAAWHAGANGPLNPGPMSPMYGGTLVVNQNGGLISGGTAYVSCDDGATYLNSGAPNIPVNAAAVILKLGPSECILITAGFAAPTTQTVCYYSADGGETWQGGDVWLASTIGEHPIASFVQSDGHPFTVTQFRIFNSSGVALGIFNNRVVCPLANAGLASARPLLLCGAPLTPVCKD
jgi:hypothetical protein